MDWKVLRGYRGTGDGGWKAQWPEYILVVIQRRGPALSHIPGIPGVERGKRQQKALAAVFSSPIKAASAVEGGGDDERDTEEKKEQERECTSM